MNQSPWGAASPPKRTLMDAVHSYLRGRPNGCQTSAVALYLRASGLYKSRADNPKKASLDFTRRLLKEMARLRPDLVHRKWVKGTTASAEVYILREDPDA